MSHMSHVTHESCHTWLRKAGTHTHVSFCGMSHTPMSHVIHTNESCYTRVMSHIGHVTHESRHT